jgi:hypothetical protein
MKKNYHQFQYQTQVHFHQKPILHKLLHKKRISENEILNMPIQSTNF